MSSLFKLFLRHTFLLCYRVSIVASSAFMLSHVIWRSDIKLYMNVYYLEKYFSKQIFRVIRMCLYVKFSVEYKKLFLPCRKWWFMCLSLSHISLTELTFFSVKCLLLNRFHLEYEFHSRFVYTSSHIPYASECAMWSRVEGKIYLSIILKMPFSNFHEFKLLWIAS